MPSFDVTGASLTVVPVEAGPIRRLHVFLYACRTTALELLTATRPPSRPRISNCTYLLCPALPEGTALRKRHGRRNQYRFHARPNAKPSISLWPQIGDCKSPRYLEIARMLIIKRSKIEARLSPTSSLSRFGAGQTMLGISVAPSHRIPLGR